MTAPLTYKVGDFVETLPMKARGDAISARWNLHAGSMAEIEEIRVGGGLQFVVTVPWSPVERWVVDGALVRPTEQHAPSWSYLEQLTGWVPRRQPLIVSLPRSAALTLWRSLSWMFVWWLP